MKVYAVINQYRDEYYISPAEIVSPMYINKEEAMKHMFSREDPDDTIREYELKDKFEEEA